MAVCNSFVKYSITFSIHCCSKVLCFVFVKIMFELLRVTFALVYRYFSVICDENTVLFCMNVFLRNSIHFLGISRQKLKDLSRIKYNLVHFILPLNKRKKSNSPELSFNTSPFEIGPVSIFNIQTILLSDAKEFFDSLYYSKQLTEKSRFTLIVTLV